MVTANGTRKKARVLLVTDDDAFSAAVKAWLGGVETLSLTEGAVQTAIRAGLDVTRGVDLVLLDSSISSLLKLRLYERLRPSDLGPRVPVIFARSKLAPTAAGAAHQLDFYQPEGAPPDQTARLIAHVLGIRLVPPRVAERFAAPAAEAVAARGRRAAGQPAAPGFLQRLGLWGVAGTLVAFTLWPLVGAGPVRDVAQVPVAVLTAAQLDLAGDLGLVQRGH